MEQLEKVEKLRQRANVSYEEAKKALEENNWDLLEAMVALEKAGKVKGPENTTYSTSFEEQPQYVSVQETIDEQKKENAGENGFAKFGRLCRKLFQKTQDNFFCVYKKEELLFKVPLWAFLLVLLLFFKVTVVVMIVALFFQCRYSFVGRDDLSAANKAMDKAGEFADKVKEEYDKL